jgi:hypothetical protein
MPGETSSKAMTSSMVPVIKVPVPVTVVSSRSVAPRPWSLSFLRRHSEGAKRFASHRPPVAIVGGHRLQGTAQ